MALLATGTALGRGSFRGRSGKAKREHAVPIVWSRREDDVGPIVRGRISALLRGKGCATVVSSTIATGVTRTTAPAIVIALSRKDCPSGEVIGGGSPRKVASTQIFRQDADCKQLLCATAAVSTAVFSLSLNCRTTNGVHSLRAIHIKL